MSTHINLAAALTLSVATLGQANAEQLTEATTRFFLPPVVGAAYSDKAVATSPAEVRRQGGFVTPEAVQWRPAPAHEAQVTVAPHYGLPSVIGAGYGDQGVATSALEVQHQGGFATAGTVRWLPAAPVEKKLARTAQAQLALD